MIAVFRNKSQEATATVRLPLIPAGKYRVRSVLSGKELGVFADSDWSRGVAVKFSDAVPLEILEVSSIKG
jgi:predicted RNA-binding protein (virulence factor B family)